MVDWKKASALLVLCIFLTSFVFLSGCVMTDPIDKSPAAEGGKTPFYDQMWFVWLLTSVLMWVVLFSIVLIFMMIAKKDTHGKVLKTFGWLSLIFSIALGTGVFWNPSIRGFAQSITAWGPWWLIGSLFLLIPIFLILLFVYVFGLFGGAGKFASKKWKWLSPKEKEKKAKEEGEDLDESEDLLEKAKKILDELQTYKTKLADWERDATKIIEDVDAGNLSEDDIHALKELEADTRLFLKREFKSVGKRLDELKDICDDLVKKLEEVGTDEFKTKAREITTICKDVIEHHARVEKLIRAAYKRIERLLDGVAHKTPEDVNKEIREILTLLKNGRDQTVGEGRDLKALEDKFEALADIVKSAIKDVTKESKEEGVKKNEVSELASDVINACNVMIKRSDQLGGDTNPSIGKWGGTTINIGTRDSVEYAKKIALKVQDSDEVTASAKEELGDVIKTMDGVAATSSNSKEQISDAKRLATALRRLIK